LSDDVTVLVERPDLGCWDFDEEQDPDRFSCCGECHGDGETGSPDVRHTFRLVDGRTADLCCGKIRKVVSLGQLDPAALGYVAYGK
jgi:hypothetical protein